MRTACDGSGVAKTNADASAAAVQAAQAQVAEVAAKASADGASTSKIEADSKALLASVTEILATAKTAHDRVTEYQNKLTELTTSFRELHNKIESLLPNATSAGLASAFRNQKSRFTWPQYSWLATFLIAIVMLLLAGLIGLPGFWPSDAGNQPTWDAIWRHFVARLPLVIPLVWLAIYAGRHYSLALRVQEEYAFKEALSTAFEGYKREMAGISSSSDGAPTPLINLCENVLRLLAERPGRIYEGKHEDITPFTPLLTQLKEVVPKLSESLPKKPGT